MATIMIMEVSDFISPSYIDGKESSIYVNLCFPKDLVFDH